MTDQNDKRIWHPSLKGHYRDVPAKDAAAWKDAGWRLTEPSDDEAERAEEKTQPKKA